MSETYTVRSAQGEVMYRLIGRSTPRLRDFQSDRDKGRPRELSQGYADYVGLSVFDSEDLARGIAVRFPVVIAAFRLEAGRGFDLARTYSSVEGYHTIWGEPADLLERVEAVSRHEAPE